MDCLRHAPGLERRRVRTLVRRSSRRRRRPRWSAGVGRPQGAAASSSASRRSRP